MSETRLIVMSAEQLAAQVVKDTDRAYRFRVHDNGTVYSAIQQGSTVNTVRGTVRFSRPSEGFSVSRIGHPKDRVRVLAWREETPGDQDTSESHTAIKWRAKGFVRQNGDWKEVPVLIEPLAKEISSRRKGILETDVLSASRVFVAGAGSVGSWVISEFAKMGVGHFILMDHDIFTAANVSRHVLGVPHVGRFKVDGMEEAIHERNPWATVEKCDQKITWDNEDVVLGFVRESDIVVCAADDRDARVIINNHCVAQQAVVIFVGAFRRAHGGQLLIVRPGGPCYQCFLMALPPNARDEEVASAQHAERLAYSDRPVPIEPGLGNDLAPLSSLVVKLASCELLRTKPTTLRSLEEDLIAPWYFWLNRREQGTQYEQLGPLGFKVDGMRILRWYGINLKRNERCLVCGDSEGGVVHS